MSDHSNMLTNSSFAKCYALTQQLWVFFSYRKFILVGLGQLIYSDMHKYTHTRITVFKDNNNNTIDKYHRDTKVWTINSVKFSLCWTEANMKKSCCNWVKNDKTWLFERGKKCLVLLYIKIILYSVHVLPGLRVMLVTHNHYISCMFKRSGHALRWRKVFAIITAPFTQWLYCQCSSQEKSHRNTYKAQ